MKHLKTFENFIGMNEGRDWDDFSADEITNKNNMIDFAKIEENLEKAFEAETPESFKKWLMK